MEIYTIGFTQTTVEHFFGRLKAAGVRRLVDVRLNNSSQLAGFAKARDLEYLLGQLLGASYEHETLLAPTQELLDDYRKREGEWGGRKRDAPLAAQVGDPLAATGATPDPGHGTLHDMKEAPMKVTLTEPGIAGDYIVVEHNADGSVLLSPDTSAAAIERRLGVEPASEEDFERHVGHLPRDGEG